MSTDFKTITASPVSPALGAEISGVDIAAGVDEEQFAELRQAYVDYGVIFLREQESRILPRISTSSLRAAGAISTSIVSSRRSRPTR
jgi:taurine dioxygenase